MKIKAVISNNAFLLARVWQISKSRFWIESLRAVISTANVVANIYLNKLVFDAIAEMRPFYTIVFYLFLMLATYGIGVVYQYWYSHLYQPKSDLYISSVIRRDMFKRQKNADLIQYDNPEFYNKRLWAANDADTRHLQVLNTFFSFVTALLMSISVLISTIMLEPYLLLFALVFIVASYFTNLKFAEVSYEFDRETVAKNRRMSYPGTVFFSVRAAKELRLYGISGLLNKIYHDAVNEYCTMITHYGRRKAKYYMIFRTVEMLFGRYLPLVFVTLRAILTQAYSVGTVTSIITVVGSLRNSVRGLIDVFPKMQENSLYIENYRRFLGMEAEIGANEGGEEAKSGANGIELRDVSYRYSKDGPEVLHGINMKIKAGEKVAIVGYNGAGKTTLVKLMMRLYEPESGSVVMDGKEAEEYRLESYRSRFGVIFQDYQMYAVSVAENVLMGEYEEGEKGRVEEALKRSGLYERVEEEPDGIETNVMKEYDEKGIIFSGGQAQKMAIARVFARECGIVVMDEPSSALDPVSEYEMHKHMLEASEDKTVVLISHRLSTTRDADRIYYMEHGEIVEEGTHEELMERDGKYAYMFRLQADQYNRQPEVL